MRLRKNDIYEYRPRSGKRTISIMPPMPPDWIQYEEITYSGVEKVHAATTPRQFRDLGIDIDWKLDSAENVYFALKVFFQRKKSEYEVLILTNRDYRIQKLFYLTSFSRKMVNVKKLLGMLPGNTATDTRIIFVHNHPNRLQTRGQRGLDLLAPALLDSMPSPKDVKSASQMVDLIIAEMNSGNIQCSSAPTFYVRSNYACTRYYPPFRVDSYSVIPKLERAIVWSMGMNPVYKISVDDIRLFYHTIGKLDSFQKDFSEKDWQYLYESTEKLVVGLKKGNSE